MTNNFSTGPQFFFFQIFVFPLQVLNYTNRGKEGSDLEYPNILNDLTDTFLIKDMNASPNSAVELENFDLKSWLQQDIIADITGNDNPFGLTGSKRMLDDLHHSVIHNEFDHYVSHQESPGIWSYDSEVDSWDINDSGAAIIQFDNMKMQHSIQLQNNDHKDKVQFVTEDFWGMGLKVLPEVDRKIFLEQAFAIFSRTEFWLRICRPLRNFENLGNYR
jgi:hypothetical protein